MMEKNAPHYQQLNFPLPCGFSNGYGIRQKYPPIWVLVLVSDLNQTIGIGRTLDESKD